MKLTQSNYFSTEAMTEYMSTSQFKAFEQCEARAMHELRHGQDDKTCFVEGHYFEAALNGGEQEELFLMQHPEMVSSRGATKGELKANFAKIVGSVEAFKRQPLFMDIIGRCEQQVIVTGIINGIKYKGCIDFLNMATLDSYDTKCMRDFKKVWSDAERCYLNWYFAYGYHYQGAIYKELVRQTFGRSGNSHILAVTKEERPDVMALRFADDRLKKALEIVEEYSPRYDQIKKGSTPPERCEICDYCKATKKINEFEIIEEFE